MIFTENQIAVIGDLTQRSLAAAEKVESAKKTVENLEEYSTEVSEIIGAFMRVLTQLIITDTEMDMKRSLMTTLKVDEEVFE